MSTAQATLPQRPRLPVASGRRDAAAESEYRHGLALAKEGRWAPAVHAFRRAVQRCPDDAVFWLNLADAHVKLGQLDDGVTAARRALDIDPTSTLAVAIAAQCLTAANRHEETIELLHRLDLESAKGASLHFALGNALTALHRHREAIEAFLGALRRQPDFMPAHAHLGNVFEREKMHLEARECFQTALALGGDKVTLLSSMTYHAQHACRWDLLQKDLAGLQQALPGSRQQPVPFHLLTLPSSRQEQLESSRVFYADRWASVAALPPAGPRAPGARIRIGYATSDLFKHATAYLIADLIETHDRERFEVFVYSYGHDDSSEIRRRIATAAGAGFVDASRMSDAQLAERVRRDDIDILLDLKGYTQGTRVGLFALRPARLQVNYLGYPGTMGAASYDYIVGDRIVSPLAHEDGFSEKIAQLPHCYQPNDRRRPIGPRPSRADCGLPEAGFVFCSFNTCYKITAPVFDRWCRLLQQVEGSVLWLYEANDQARPNLLREAAARGIDPARIVWAPHADLAEHLGRLQLADLVLDTLPVNAHTTASDALWAGVPIVTTPGESFVSRVASSILQAAGMEELVAVDGDAYERLALELVREPQRLRAIRARLAANRDSCPLFDCERYTRDLEHLFSRMLDTWARGEPPRHLTADGA